MGQNIMLDSHKGTGRKDVGSGNGHAPVYEWGKSSGRIVLY